MSDRTRVDMHMHSTASDGELTPSELAARCAAAGLGTVALTDHNTTANVAAMVQACAAHGIEVVPACEISTRWSGRELHLLAYFVPPEDHALAERLERVRSADEARSRAWVEAAAADGVAITWDEVREELGPRVPPFALLAALLLERTAEDRRFDAHRERRGGLYADWFAPGRPWGTDPPWQPATDEAIGWVRDAGGVPVLAHPGASLGDLDPDGTLRSLGGAGLLGVEAWTTWHKEGTAERYAALGADLGLTVTAGADFHGPRVKPFVREPGQVSHNGVEVLRSLSIARQAA